MLEERPAEFYFRRLGPPECNLPKEPQSFPAAVGIAFDAYVKRRVADVRGLRCPSVDYMLNEVQCQREAALKLAQGLMAGYERSGALANLLSAEPSSVVADAEDFAPGTRVPIRTRIDCRVKAGIHDWKTMGANRPGTKSPTQGYAMVWDTGRPGIPDPAHAKHGLPMEQIDSNWATQLTMYGWAEGFPIRPDLVGSIDEVIPWHGDRVRVACFRARISEDFQRNVKVRLEDAWRKIESREVLPRDLTIEEARVML